MQLSHSQPVVSATFDEPNLVSAAGLVPLMALAQDAGLDALGDEHVRVPGDKGSNAGSKLAALVAVMAAGADSIDALGVLRATDLELATLGWVDWFNHTRIHSSLNYRTPAEVEKEYYSHNHITAEQPLAAELTV